MRAFVTFLFLLPATAAAKPSFQTLGDEVVAKVRDNFYRPDVAKVWAEKYRGYGAQAKDAGELARLTKAALAELAASHTYYFPRDSVENVQLRAIFAPMLKAQVKLDSIGVDFVELEGHWFVRGVLAGGSGAAAGLKRGDRIVSADGKPLHPYLSFAGKSGRKVKLQLQREPEGAPLELVVTPVRIAPTDEWLKAQDAGSRIVERKGKKIAYHPIFACAGPGPMSALDRIWKERFQAADALVLDLRDGWGGCMPEFTNIFNRQLGTLKFTDRAGKERTWASSWTKPVVLLVNENSKSGKEIIAFLFQKYRLGPIVGARTAGAFLAGRPFVLADGSVLYLAVEDVRVDGVRLEGNGIAPTVEVKDVLLFADGADPQLERAIDEAAAISSP